MNTYIKTMEAAPDNFFLFKLIITTLVTAKVLKIAKPNAKIQNRGVRPVCGLNVSLSFRLPNHFLNNATVETTGVFFLELR